MNTLHVVVAMKPIEGTFADNALKHGVAGINVDACRIGFSSREDQCESQNKQTRKTIGGFSKAEGTLYGTSRGVGWIDNSEGRWPANVIHDGSEEVLAGFPRQKSNDKRDGSVTECTARSWKNTSKAGIARIGYIDAGLASRFFKQIGEI